MCQSSSYNCDGKSGIITSPYYPYQSDNAVTCTWQISTPGNTFVCLNFTHFYSDLNSDSCDEAHVKIAEDLSDTTNIVIAEYCAGTPPTSHIESSLNTVLMELRSMLPNNGIVFMVEYQAVSFEISTIHGSKRIAEGKLQISNII